MYVIIHKFKGKNILLENNKVLLSEMFNKPRSSAIIF